MAALTVIAVLVICTVAVLPMNTLQLVKKCRNTKRRQRWTKITQNQTIPVIQWITMKQQTLRIAIQILNTAQS